MMGPGTKCIRQILGGLKKTAKEVMETPRPDDAVSPGKPLQWLIQSPSLPCRMQPPPMDPVPGALHGSQLSPKAMPGSSPAPVFPHASPSLPLACPQVCKLLLSASGSSAPPCSNHSKGPSAPVAAAQLQRHAAGSCCCAGAGAVQEAAPSHASIELPGGLQARREN